LVVTNQEVSNIPEKREGWKKVENEKSEREREREREVMDKGAHNTHMKKGRLGEEKTRGN
jgi:hypothetical protein